MTSSMRERMAADGLTDEQIVTITALPSRQVELPPEFAAVIYENRSEFYCLFEGGDGVKP